MNEELQQRLLDALEAAELITIHVAGQSSLGFLRDTWFRAATERQLLTIGEALNHVRRLDPMLAERLPAVHEWIALRNVLAYLYDRVDAKIVWDTVNDDLPDLIEALRLLTAETG